MRCTIRSRFGAFFIIAGIVAGIAATQLTP